MESEMGNLIEQLGGYETTKEYLKKNSHFINFEGLERFYDELLEYRREHKFYEVGDLVVCEHFEMDEVKHLLTVEIVRGHYLQLSDGVSCTAHLVRHATDEEVESGGRL